MRQPPAPVLRDLVLVGGGHSHVIVLRRFGMRPMPGVRLTVVCREPHTPYSGMLPGLVAGHYTFDETHIDLAPLCRFAGARLYRDEVTGIDPESRVVHCRERPPVPYDAVSIDVGSTPVLGEVRGAAGRVTPVKPIGVFWERWQALYERARTAPGTFRVAVAGAGAGGIELALAAHHALSGLFDSLGRSRDRMEVRVISKTAEILPTHPAGVRRRFRRVLARRGIPVHAGDPVVEVGDGALRLASGAVVETDEVLWVTEAGAASWFASSGLAVDERGFIRVEPTLRSASHEDVFAAGDCAAVTAHPRPKAGVFAVRQGRPLERNLRRALLGRSLLPFRPQREFLSLISTGDRYAVGSRGRLSFEGRWVWRWKDRIDRRFMRRFHELPEMDSGDDALREVPEGLAPPDVLSALARHPMRCGGCGAKIGATLLDRVLDRLPRARAEGLLIGLDAPDDAAAMRVPEGRTLVQTVDFFRSMVDDPWVFGRIAANHALGDLWAMGAEPWSALAIAVVPYGSESKVEATLEAMLRGAAETLESEGAALLGGHSGEGVELALGFAANGLVAPDGLLRKSGLRPGDRLLLTKPLGTGTILAADMQGKAKARWTGGAIRSMLASSREASAILRAHGARAATDVTGFGLAGHLLEMARPSGVGVRVSLAALPLLDGARETVEAGIFSSLQPENLRLRRAVRDDGVAEDDPRRSLLFDPQTAGGLLAGVPAERADDCLAALRSAGCTAAAVVGEAEAGTDAARPLLLVP